MFSGEKTLVNEKNFSPSDLIQYIEILIKESKLQQRRNSLNSNYGWLKSRDPVEEMDNRLDNFNNMVLKLSPESRVAIAVKLDRLANESHLSPAAIITTFSKLLEEEQNIELLENVKPVKDRKKISPKLEERSTSLSFIFNRKTSVPDIRGSVPY